MKDRKKNCPHRPTAALPPMELLTQALCLLIHKMGTCHIQCDDVLSVSRATWYAEGLTNPHLSLVLIRQRASLPRAGGSRYGIGGEGGRQTRLTPGFFLSAVAKEGLVALQRELREVTLPDFDGDFKIKHVGRGNYEFHRWGSLLLGPQGGGGGSLEKEAEPRDWVRTTLKQTVGQFLRVQREVLGGNWNPLFAHATNSNEGTLTP